jgi:hypothetical protein
VSGIRDSNAINDMAKIAFGNRTVVMSFDRTCAVVTNASNSDAIDSKMRCAHIHDLAAVGSGIA